jgi:hypothetical protein
VKKKQPKPRAEKIEDDADDSMAIDAYEELAVFFDEEDPLSLVSLGRAASARALSNP